MSRYTVFTGVGTALVTPFDDSGHVDLDALGTLIDRQIDGGADALVMTGTTGEAPVLSADEKKEIWRFTRARIDSGKRKVPLIAGSGGNNTEAAAALAHDAELAGADALLVVTPYYNKSSQAGLCEHYRRIAGSTSLPVIAYTVPSHTGVNVAPDTWRKLASIPNIVGVKDATGDLRHTSRLSVMLELPARRGGFYDCRGLPLTGLEKRWLALCFPGQENYTRLYACTDTAGQELLYRSRSRAAPFLVEVDRDMTALGIPCYAASRRYAAAPLCPQLLGYLDGEGHGAAGLEKALDALLTGSGARDTLLCPVTAQGTLRTGEQVQHLQADSGAVGVRLTLSRSVQRAAEAVAAQTMTTGCILVLDVPTAALRACVSVPGFDPADPAASLEAPDSPFLNRALQAYAVGSVFKPVLAAAALEAGLAPEYDCNGAVVVDGQIFRCAGGVPHGEVDLSAALAKSCNGYFIRLGQQLGAQALLQQAQALGFGRSIGLAEGLTAQSGALPGAEELAQSGQLANFSFGQGSLLATPLQVAAMMNTIANGGVYRAPCLLDCALDETSGEELSAFARPQAERVLTEQTAAALRTMLEQTVAEGTAQDASGLPGGAAGKTGTAQTGQFTAEGKERKNLWFAGFYPAEDPQYTIVVLQDGQTQAAVSSAAVFAQLCTALHWLG